MSLHTTATKMEEDDHEGGNYETICGDDQKKELVALRKELQSQYHLRMREGS